MSTETEASTTAGAVDGTAGEQSASDAPALPTARRARTR